ncbi:MAG: squalene synthase HpnC [Acidimicrobiales bacterium]|nr:MAG: squalene synthase HpnC [Acidimicrobiales bacterium]
MPGGIPTAEAIMARAASENFPVASRLLPRAARGHLLAIYGFARLVDELGDKAPGDRLANLDWLEAELERAYRGQASHPVLVRLTPSLRGLDLPDQAFRDLIQANRQDQIVHRYATFDDLVGYCRLSANPVGRLVLAAFGVATAERVALSDQVCTGLQLVEHWQDVAEDSAAGRVYLPTQDMERFGCSPSELRWPVVGPHLRALLAFEAARARLFLDAGSPLVASLRGRPALAVAGFIAGGQATLDAIERSGFDVLATNARRTGPRMALRLAHLMPAVLGRRGEP